MKVNTKVNIITFMLLTCLLFVVWYRIAILIKQSDGLYNTIMEIGKRMCLQF